MKCIKKILTRQIRHNIQIFTALSFRPLTLPLTGLGKGGQTVSRCKDTAQKAIKLLVELASLQTSFITLDEAIKITNRRVNGIEYVIIPRLVLGRVVKQIVVVFVLTAQKLEISKLFVLGLGIWCFAVPRILLFIVGTWHVELYDLRYENTIAYVVEELDEREREEFYRLKKVQDKKKVRVQGVSM